MGNIKQYDRVIINADMTNCPGHAVQARVLSVIEEKGEAFVQVLTRCHGCDCGADARFIKLKYLEVSHE